MNRIILILNEKHQKELVGVFQHSYSNYTIKFVNSKEIPSNCREIERNSLWLCDTDESIKELKTIYKDSFPMPVIAYSHQDNPGESLIEAPWMILSPDGLTPDLIEEVKARYEHLPLTTGETKRCLLRELTASDLPFLLQLQEENKKNPGGCFFPENCAAPDQYLKDYIRHQYYYYGFGLYGVYLKPALAFMGITGFSLTDIPGADAEVSYALLKKYQCQGYAREVVTKLLVSTHIHQPDHPVARISPDNQASLKLARELKIPLLLDG